jgi:type IV secretory pathway VirB3-like protein
LNYHSQAWSIGCRFVPVPKFYLFSSIMLLVYMLLCLLVCAWLYINSRLKSSIEPMFACIYVPTLPFTKNGNLFLCNIYKDNHLLFLCTFHVILVFYWFFYIYLFIIYDKEHRWNQDGKSQDEYFITWSWNTIFLFPKIGKMWEHLVPGQIAPTFIKIAPTWQFFFTSFLSVDCLRAQPEVCFTFTKNGNLFLCNIYKDNHLLFLCTFHVILVFYWFFMLLCLLVCAWLYINSRLKSSIEPMFACIYVPTLLTFL